MSLAPTATFQAPVPVMLLASCPTQEHRVVAKEGRDGNQLGIAAPFTSCLVSH